MNSLVNFGSGYVNSSNNSNYCEITTNGTFNGTGACGGGLTNNTSPFYIQNNGNENVNLTLNASANASGFVTGGAWVAPQFQWMLSDNATQNAARVLRPERYGIVDERQPDE